MKRDSLEEMLVESRPTLSPLELDDVKQRARRQAARTAQTYYGWRGIRMKPRLAATALLVTGMFFTGSGATLAVISDTGSAAQVQYPETPLPTTGGGSQPTQQEGGGSQPTQQQGGAGAAPQSEVLGESFGGGKAPTGGANEVLGDTAEGGSAPAGDAPAAVEATRQLEIEGGDELPFTGFAAIPILIAGIVMLAFGMTMRRALGRTTA